MITKLRSVNLKQLTTKAKMEMARLFGSWYEANMGRDSARIKEIRELSTRLLAAIEAEDIQGEYIIFVNNYVAFLIVECENDLSRQLLEIWVRKVKTSQNIEWILLLFSSYVELVVRSSEASLAAQKVTAIVNLVTKHVESADRKGKLTPLLLKSYCTILINHAKLTLANEETSNSIEQVKGIVANIRKYNSFHTPDQTIEAIVSKIEMIYQAPTESRQKDCNSRTLCQTSKAKGLMNGKPKFATPNKQSVPNCTFLSRRHRGQRFDDADERLHKAQLTGLPHSEREKRGAAAGLEQSQEKRHAKGKQR